LITNKLFCVIRCRLKFIFFAEIHKAWLRKSHKQFNVSTLKEIV